MNSLEFIENIIKNLSQLRKEEDKQIEDNKNYPSLLEIHICEKEHFEKEIARFEQIKAELEAWYVVKKHTIITDGGVIHMAVEDDEIGYEKLEKALEIRKEQ